MCKSRFAVVLLLITVLIVGGAACGDDDSPGPTWVPDGGGGNGGGSSGPKPTPVYADWEITGDGCVDAMDATVIGQKWGQTGDPGWIKEDINRDGVIDEADMEYIHEHMGEGCP